MAVLVKDLDIWINQVSLDELFKNKLFLSKLYLKIDDIEDEILWNMMENSEKTWIVDINYFNKYISSRIW